MPFYPEEKSFLDQIQTLPEEKDDGESTDKKRPEFFKKLLPAAFRSENTIGSYMASDGVMNRANRLDGVDKDFDPFLNIEGYEEYANSFAFANNEDEVNRIKSRIIQEKEDKKTLEDGGWMGTLALFSAGALDPINFMPTGTAMTTAKAGTSILKKALSTGRSAALGMTASEVLLHDSQETRTYGESAANIATGAFLGGVLGSAGGAFSNWRSRKNIDAAAFLESIEKDLTVPGQDAKGIDLLGDQKILITAEELAEDTGLGGSVGAALTNRTEAKMRTAFGAEYISGSPNIRTAISDNIETRRSSELLAENAGYYEKNALGVPTNVAAETEIKTIRDRTLLDVHTTLTEEYLSYAQQGSKLALKAQQVAESIGLRPKRDILKYEDFKTEIAKSLRRGDVSEIAQVQSAAKKLRKIIDGFKDEAVYLKLLPEDVKVSTAASYLTRVYDRSMIMANEGKFRKIVYSWLKQEHPELDDLDLKDIANQIFNSVTGTPSGRLNYSPIPLNTRGPMKERTFNIPDHYIEEFLVNDVDLVMEQYVKSMSADIALTKRFGSPDMAETIEKIRGEATRKRNLIKDTDKNAQKLRNKINKRMVSDISDIEAMRDILRGTFGLNSKNVDRYQFPRVLTTIKTLNYARLLGQTALAAIPDLGGPVLLHGLKRTIGDSFIPFVRNLTDFTRALNNTKGTSAYAQSIQDLKDMGIGVELVMNTRAGTLADIGNSYGTTALDKFNKKIADGVSYYSGISAWNDMTKTIAAYAGMARILRAATSSSMTKKEAEFMARFGLGRFGLEKISKQYKQFGYKERGRYAANVGQWQDHEAFNLFNFALKKMTDTSVITPGLDKPITLSTPIGSVVGQFKSFLFSAYQRYFMAGIQQRDLATLNGTLTMVGLGMLSYYLKETIAGREVDEDIDKWILEGIDKSGMTGFLMDINNTLDKVNLGVNSLVGVKPASRFAERSAAASIFGPTFGFFEDSFSTTAALTGALFYGQTPTSKQISAARRLIPYQNVILFRKIFDAAEDGIRNNLGISERNKKR